MLIIEVSQFLHRKILLSFFKGILGSHPPLMHNILEMPSIRDEIIFIFFIGFFGKGLGFLICKMCWKCFDYGSYAPSVVDG